MKPKVWVVGASGFVGSHLTEFLVAQGESVRALGLRPMQTSIKNDGSSLEFYELDLVKIQENQNNLRKLFEQDRPKIVFFCSAYGVNPADSSDLSQALSINAQAPYFFAHLCAEAGVSTMVYLGSCFEYGDKPGKIREDSVLRPTAIYGISKATGTLLLQEASARIATRIIIARLFGQWGPREGSHRLVPQLVEASLLNKPVPLTFGEQIRDFLYVSDTARILWQLSLSDCPTGEIVNVARGEGVKLREFITEIADILKINDLLLFGDLPYRENEMMSLVADTTKLRQFVTFDQWTSLQEGLKRMQ